VRENPLPPKILLYDIENTPSLGWVWEKWQTNVIDIDTEWHMLCYAYKWLGEDKVYTVAQPDFVGYDKNREDDYGVVAELWHLFDEADVVVAHNGDQFDQRKARARFLVHGFDPPSPYLEVDTKKIAKRHFNFTSNSLDDLARVLGLERKGNAGTFRETWLGCMNGDPAAWARMIKYNKQDVNVLEQVFLKLRPWAAGFPNLATLRGDDGRPGACPKCEAIDTMVKNGWRFTQVSNYQAYRCTQCGGTSRGRKAEKTAPTAYVN
jgi:hypothetical protein